MHIYSPKRPTQPEMGLNTIEVCCVGKHGCYILVNYRQQNVFFSSSYGSLSCVLVGRNAIFVIVVLSGRFKKLNRCHFAIL